MSSYIFLILYFFDYTLSQYEPQSNIDRIAQRPMLPQCPREWEWACRNGECIAHYDVCDGIVQCTDGSDEWNCDSVRQNQLAHEGNQVNNGAQHLVTTTTAVINTTVVKETGVVTIKYSHIFFAILAFFLISVAVVSVIKRRARNKSGFRNRRGNILQHDSDEDDILISSMYS